MSPDELHRRLSGRLERLPIFDVGHYLALNPDAGPSPHAHFAQRGLRDGRAFTTTERIRRFLRSASLEMPAAEEPASTQELTRFYEGASRMRVGVFASSGGNFFMREIGELIVRGLRAVGVDASLHDEHGDIAARPRYCVFVAPHEFFRIGRGVEWAREDVLETSFMYATEQMHTPWFSESLGFVLRARGVIDLNYQSYRLFEQTGMPALHHSPGYTLAEEDGSLPDHPLARALPRAVRSFDPGRTAWTERPLDLVFLGAESPAREAFLARNAGFFAGLSSFVYYARLSGIRRGPFTASAQENRPRLNSFLARRAKIVLNIHQGDVGYFEWHRMVVQGMWQRAVVVTDSCLPHPLFKPGIHFMEETRSRIPELVDWLLRTPDGRVCAERVRAEAFATAVERASARDMGLRLARFLQSHG